MPRSFLPAFPASFLTLPLMLFAMQIDLLLAFK